jgi:hypothetical protein
MALTQEISFAQAQLDADRAKLVELENCTTEPFNGWKGFGRTPLDRVPELKVLRERIAVTQARIDDLTATQNELLDREWKREKDSERKEQWKRLIPVCRELKEKDHAQQLLVLKLRDARDTAAAKRDAATTAVNDHAANPPSWDSYPSESELEQYRLDGIDLEEARVRANAAYGQADKAYERAVRDFVELRQKFESAAHQEKNLRPSDV